MATSKDGSAQGPAIFVISVTDADADGTLDRIEELLGEGGELMRLGHLSVFATHFIDLALDHIGSEYGDWGTVEIVVERGSIKKVALKTEYLLKQKGK